MPSQRAVQPRIIEHTPHSAAIMATMLQPITGYESGALLNDAKYRIDREINRGATAVVYAADDLQSKRKVALKVGSAQGHAEGRLRRSAPGAPLHARTAGAGGGSVVASRCAGLGGNVEFDVMNWGARHR